MPMMMRISALFGILHAVSAMAAASQEAVGWLDYKFTKQGASPNEIYAKLVPFFTKAGPGGDYPPGMVFLFGGSLWIGFMLFIGAWVWFCPHNPFTLLLGGDATGPERPRAAAQWRKPIKTH